MTSQARKDLEAQFAIGLESAAALAAQGKSVCCVINESRDDGTTIVRMHPEFRGRLQYGTELYVRAEPKPAQQAAQHSPNVPMLTDEEIEREWQFMHGEDGSRPTHHDFANAIEQLVHQKAGLVDSLPQPAQQPVSEPVFLVATGETHNGEETYTRHDGCPPPLCDFETLYTAPQPAQQPVAAVSADEVENGIEKLRAEIDILKKHGFAPQPAQQAAVSEQQASSLASALAGCILASGIVSGDKSGFSGPELLFLAGDLEELLLRRAPQPAQQPGVEPASGWRLVPVEPTMEMAMAFAKSFSIYDQQATFPEAVKAMLAAAPQPAQQPGGAS